MSTNQGVVMDRVKPLLAGRGLARPVNLFGLSEPSKSRSMMLRPDRNRLYT